MTINDNKNHVDNYHNNGFIVLEQAISEALIDSARSEWDDFHKSPKESVVPGDDPLVVFWRHFPGEQKILRPLREFQAIQEIAFDKNIAELVKSIAQSNFIRIFEVIVFSKPPRISPVLRWHQDNSYFPFEPSNQVASWIPFEKVTKESGSLQYVVGSHKHGERASVDLHSGDRFDGDVRKIIPSRIDEPDHEINYVEISPGDMSIHHGQMWHCSGQNITENQRRSLSIRYLVGETKFRPTPGAAATFIQQINANPGELVEGSAFPAV